MLDDLKLEEKFMLVVTNTPASNRLHLQRSYLQVYTIGAAMIDMLLEGELQLDANEKFVIPSGATTEPSRQLLLEIIAASKNPKKMKTWIANLIYNSGKRNRAFNALIAPEIRSGLISQEEYKVLWLFPAKRFTADSREKDLIIQGLRAELLEEGPVSVQTSALVMLLEASKQLKNYFSEYERSEMKARLKRLQTEQNAEWKIIEQIRKAISEIESSSVAGAAVAASAGAS